MNFAKMSLFPEISGKPEKFWKICKNPELAPAGFKKSLFFRSWYYIDPLVRTIFVAFSYFL